MQFTISGQDFLTKIIFNSTIGTTLSVQSKGKTFESMTLDCIEPEITTADMIGNALEIKVTGDLHSEELDKGVHPDELERLRYLKGKN